MDYAEPYYKINILTLMIVSILFVIIYLIYFSLVIFYVIKNYHSRKLCIFWIDYFILISIAVLFIIIYIFNNLINEPIKEEYYLSNLFDNNSTVALIGLLIIMCVTIINSFLFDSITAIKLSWKMNKIKKIDDKDFLALSEKFKDIKIVNILKMNYMYKYYIIFSIVILIYSILFIILYKDDEPEKINSFFNLYNYFNYLLRFYHLIVLALFLVSVIVMNLTKRALLKKQYYNPNRIAQKVYDAHFSQIVYFTDVISFKLVSDLIINVPPLLFLSQERFNTFGLIISEFAIFLYTFIGGNGNLVIDKDSKGGKIGKYIYYWFCMKKVDFHFGEKEHKEIFDEFNFNYSQEEQEVINNLNTTIIKNIEKDLLDLDDDKMFDERATILGLDKNVSNRSTINKLDKKIILDFKSVPEFYLIQKLIMVYFKKNGEMYESAFDSIEENGLDFKKLGQSKKNRRNQILQDNDFISNLNRISRMSIRNVQKLKNSLKISQKEIINSIEEKELFDELQNKLNIKNDRDKSTFTIESLLTSELFELLPFYRMKLNNVLISLNPTRNIKLFNKFIQRNSSISNYIITNTNSNISVKSSQRKNCNNSNTTNNNMNNDNININININLEENKKEYESNLYYTHDLYLMYEIYDKSDFVKFEQLKKLIQEYNKYLLSVVETMSSTFLPLIIGIFDIEIYNSEKIIILYRNPLYFSNFNHFNHWINFYITEEPEKMKVSSLFNEVININEIEIRNSLQLNEADYDEIKIILEKDCSFLKKVANIFPIVHLFIGNEVQDDPVEGEEEANTFKNKNKKRKTNNQYIENSILGDLSLNKDIGLFDDVLENINNSILNNESENFNDMIMQTDDNSLYDKEYYYMSGKDIRTIKIYFTNLFRRDCVLNNIKKNKDNKLDSESYCEYIQDQLLRYLIKKSLFNDEPQS